jgi:transposase
MIGDVFRIELHACDPARNHGRFYPIVGLAPNPYQSGQMIRTRLSKVGDALLRKILYMPALTAQRYNPAIRTFCERLRAQGKNGKAIVCAAMRKLIHIAFGVLKSNQPFDPKIALV